MSVAKWKVESFESEIPVTKVNSFHDFVYDVLSKELCF